MRAKGFVATLLFLTLGMACSQATKPMPVEDTDLSRLDLVGPVKSCTSHAYHEFDDVDTLSANWQGPLLEKVETRFFDPHGMMICLISEGLDGHSTELLYVHNEAHQLVEIAQSKAPGDVLFTESFAYDKDGDRVEVLKMQSPGDPSRRVTYTYDHKRRLIEERSYLGSDSVTSRVVLTYNEYDKLSTVSNYNGMSALTSEEAYTYDTAGVLIRTVETYTDDHYSSIESHYDQEGRVVETTMRYYGGGYRKYVYTYGRHGSVDKSIYTAEGDGTTTFEGVDRIVCDEHGRSIEEASLEPSDDGSLRIHRRLFHRYDEGGRLVETREVDPGDNQVGMRTWLYEYDERGNWIKQTITLSEGEGVEALPQSISITTRKIEYYK